MKRFKIERPSVGVPGICPGHGLGKVGYPVAVAVPQVQPCSGCKLGEIGQSVSVRVGPGAVEHQRIESRSLGFETVAKLIAIRVVVGGLGTGLVFFQICQPVIIRISRGIIAFGVEPVCKFPTISHLVIIRILVKRVGLERFEFLQIA
ncbi:hypothetical protein OJ996_13990 [Luteolibacter sp. GHJ8]|uniref:Uncharacterized protein n=1 Tax=Luteolibacter rhizosphaerae TaxID=2989719 RepID=A0ABT3G551_9BACT|nr:hypothetical protein [Luteolibacter rhizosphaerae]MCW1914694.1 hypothetical protein [Luteolibacter rhizosphaerae]